MIDAGALPYELLRAACVGLTGRLAPDPDNLRFYVDESALGLGKALSHARRDTVHVGHPLLPECPLGVVDPDWIPAVAARDLVVIGRDRRIRTAPSRAASAARGGPEGLLDRRQARSIDLGLACPLVRNWNAMEEIIDERGSGPGYEPEREIVRVGVQIRIDRTGDRPAGRCIG